MQPRVTKSMLGERERDKERERERRAKMEES